MSNQEITLREKILEASRKVLFTSGYDFLSMRKIATASGVSATSIYLYFKNKDHLVHTIIEESVEELSTAIETKASHVDGTIEKFESIIRSYVDFALNQPEKYLVIYTIKSETMGRYPKEKFRKARRGYALLESVIQEGINEGLMSLDQPLISAYSIWAQLHGIIDVVLNKRLDSRIEQSKFIKESIDQIIQGFLIRITTT